MFLVSYATVLLLTLVKRFVIIQAVRDNLYKIFCNLNATLIYNIMKKNHKIKINTEKLRAEISKQGWRATELSEELGLGKWDLYNMYQGRTTPIAKLTTIAKFLKKPVDFFLMPDDDTNTEELEKVINPTNYAKAASLLNDVFQEFEFEATYFSFQKILKEVYLILDSGAEVDKGLVYGMCRMASTLGEVSVLTHKISHNIGEENFDNKNNWFEEA